MLPADLLENHLQQFESGEWGGAEGIEGDKEEDVLVMFLPLHRELSGISMQLQTLTESDLSSERYTSIPCVLFPSLHPSGFRC